MDSFTLSTVIVCFFAVFTVFHCISPVFIRISCTLVYRYQTKLLLTLSEELVNINPFTLASATQVWLLQPPRYSLSILIVFLFGALHILLHYATHYWPCANSHTHHPFNMALWVAARVYPSTLLPLIGRTTGHSPQIFWGKDIDVRL